MPKKWINRIYYSRRFSMGYIDPLGRFIRDPDVNSLDNLPSSNRKTYSKPLQFLTQFVRNEQDTNVKFSLINQFFYLHILFFFRRSKKLQQNLLNPSSMK